MAGMAFQEGVQLAMIFAIFVRGAETFSATGPTNAIKQKGQSMTFTCRFDNNCEHGGWSFGGAKIYSGCNSTVLLSQFGSRASLEFDGAASSVCGKYNLQVNGLKLEDSGLFACEGTLSDRTPFIKKADLLVIDYSSKCSMSVGEPARSQSLTITCSISYVGSPPVELVLESVKDGKRVLNSTKGSKSIVYKLTAGPVYVPIYKCLLKVDFSKADPNNAINTPLELEICRSDQVNVTFPVENMKLLPQDTNYSPGKPIQCTADGFPFPVIEWKKYPGGNVITHGPRGVTLVVNEMSDLHTYQCHAMNKIGGTNYTLISYPIKVADNSSEHHAGQFGHASCTASVVMNVILSLLLAGVTAILIVYYVRIRQETKGDSVKPISNTYASDTKLSQATELKTIPPPSPEADPDMGPTYANVTVPRQSKQVDDELQYEDVPRKSNGIQAGASYSTLTAETAIIDQHGYCELRKEPTKDAKPAKKCKPAPLTPKPGSEQKNKNTSK